MRDICKYYGISLFGINPMPCPFWMGPHGGWQCPAYASPSRSACPTDLIRSSRIAMQPQLRVPTSEYRYRYGASRICVVCNHTHNMYDYLHSMTHHAFNTERAHVQNPSTGAARHNFAYPCHAACSCSGCTHINKSSHTSMLTNGLPEITSAQPLSCTKCCAGEYIAFLLWLLQV